MKTQIDTDVLIIGAGAAGLAATVGAAQSNAHVTVVEKLAYPGGRATASAVGTICGSFYRGDNLRFAMSGFPKEFTNKIIENSSKSPIQFAEKLWFIPAYPSEFEVAANFYLGKYCQNILFNSEVINIELADKEIKKIIIQKQNEEVQISAKSIVDCSGIGVSLPLTNHPTIISNEKKQASAIVFCVEGLETENEFTLQHILIKYITQHIQTEKIPDHFKLISIIPGSLNENSLMMKVGIPWNHDDNTSSSEYRTKNLVYEIYSFLKTTVPAFQNSKVKWIADEVGYRTGHRPICRTTLTENDVLSCKKSLESICNAVWPIEFWEVGNKKVDMTYFPENDHYSIPASCLISKEIGNLFFAGKLISATENAIASARVIGTCLATGYAAGVLAAYKSQNKSESKAIKFIQSQLLQ